MSDKYVFRTVPTGRIAFRTNFSGKLILQIEENDQLWSKLFWRDANSTDLAKLLITAVVTPPIIIPHEKRTD